MKLREISITGTVRRSDYNPAIALPKKKTYYEQKIGETEKKWKLRERKMKK